MAHLGSSMRLTQNSLFSNRLPTSTNQTQANEWAPKKGMNKLDMRGYAVWDSERGSLKSYSNTTKAKQPELPK